MTSSFRQQKTSFLLTGGASQRRWGHGLFWHRIKTEGRRDVLHPDRGNLDKYIGVSFNRCNQRWRGLSSCVLWLAQALTSGLMWCTCQPLLCSPCLVSMIKKLVRSHKRSSGASTVLMHDSSSKCDICVPSLALVWLPMWCETSLRRISKQRLEAVGQLQKPSPLLFEMQALKKALLICPAWKLALASRAVESPGSGLWKPAVRTFGEDLLIPLFFMQAFLLSVLSVLPLQIWLFCSVVLFFFKSPYLNS